MRPSGHRSGRIFRALLRLFPSEFRHDYGTGMEQVFRDQRREARQEPGGQRRLWTGTLGGLLVGASREHLRILRQGVVYALRVCRKNPTFAAVAVLTVALGIGSTTAVFSLVNQVLLRPLPYAEPDRLVYLWTETRNDGRDAFSGPTYHDLLEQTRSFAGLSGLAGVGSATITGHGPPERIRRLIVTTDYFDVLGVPPALGRTFVPADRQVLPAEVLQATTGVDYPTAPMVISHDLWQRRFSGSPDVIGKIVRIDSRPKEIIGVLPPHFRVFLPPEHDADPRRDAWYVSHWDQRMFPRDTRFLILLLSAVGLYGLLSHSVRQGTGEIGLRVALGADPAGVLGLVIRQGFRLTILGLLAGAAGAVIFGRILASQLFGVTAGDPVTFLAMTVLLCVTALAACVFPARRALRVDPLTALRVE